jgi:hypothetical protein
MRPKNDAMAHPLEQFHSQIEALDAAIVIARASPKKRFRHDLRTAARRVEAYVTMLDSWGICRHTRIRRIG